MSNLNSSSLTLVAIQAALCAGELLRKGFNTSFKIEKKEGKQNFVTEYDKGSEEMIISLISRKYPDHSFLAEESGSSSAPSGPVLWIIDPLDGTANFARSIPFFSISIAAVREDAVVAGVVFQPMTQELFVAEKTQGAYLNGKKLHVTDTQTWDETLAASGFPYNVEENPLHTIDRFAQIVSKGVPIRRLGSAALDLAYVAAGRFDVYWEAGLHPWDMAAGKLLVEEAGGKITHWDGRPHQLFGYQNILATNGLMHPLMIQHLNQKELWQTR